MTRKTKHAREVERIRRALDHAQKVLQKKFTFTIEPTINPDDEFTLAIGRTARGTDDRDHFMVLFQPATISTLPVSVLREAAMHEVIHAVLWRLYEMADGTVRATDSQVREEFESVTYTFQRALIGDSE